MWEVGRADETLVAKVRQLYSEMVCWRHVEAQGGVIHAREVRQNGDIVIVCSATGRPLRRWGCTGNHE